MKQNTTSSRGLRYLAFLAVLFFAGLNPASAVVPTVVVPNGLENIEGNSNNGFPFNISDFGIPSQRYQQLFSASQFSTIGAGNFITQLIFRPDVSGAAFNSTLANIQINLSITNVADDALSLTFANNVGINDTVVFSGALSLSSAFTGPAGGPKDFDIVINLTTPFFYDPSLGNLLLDVRNFSGGLTTQFDAHDPLGDGVSRVSTNSSGDVNSTTANFGDSNGLVTGFTIIPEPSTIVMLLGGTGLLLARLRLSRRSR